MEFEYLLPKAAIYDTTDRTQEARDDTANDLELPPQVTTGDQLRVWTDWPARGIRLAIGTAGDYTDITLTWKYRNEAGNDVSFSGLDDPSNGFTVTGTYDIQWDIPTDWLKRTEAGVNGYRLTISSVPGASPSITTAPLGSWLRVISPIPILYLSPSRLEEFGDWALLESDFPTGRMEYRSLRKRDRRTFRLTFEEALLSLPEFHWIKELLDFRRGGGRDLLLPAFPAFSELTADYAAGTSLYLDRADWLEPGSRLFLDNGTDYETAQVSSVNGRAEVGLESELLYDYSAGTEVTRAFRARLMARPRFSTISPFRRSVELNFREVLD